MSEPLYTWEEAMRELARRTCAAQGHSLDTIVDNGTPVAIVCSVCGKSGKVSEFS